MGGRHWKRKYRELQDTLTVGDINRMCLENGYAYGEIMPDGKQFVAFQMTITGYDIIVADAAGVNERYTYPRADEGDPYPELALATVVEAFQTWQAVGYSDDPPGWIRHTPSDRRRPAGNPADEYVAP